MAQGNRNTSGKTIKRNGRKYVVVNTTVARKGHQNVTLRLIKRAGKAYWFVLEGKGGPVRYSDFWAALEAYSVRQDELGVNPTEHLPVEEVQEIVSLNEQEQAEFAKALEVRINA